jgi:phage shock protein PspC (stress-responsive transcriptional regulator)
MNKVVTINLNGNAYQLEEIGYEMLRVYLAEAVRQLNANPDRDEVIADIEQAIGEKCRGVLTAGRNVVLAGQIEQIIAEMGPVEGGASENPEDQPDQAKHAESTPPPAGANGGPVRRLYRIYEGAMISGVCNGFAAYFGIDPTIVRAIAVLLALVTLGGMVLAYLVLILVLPTANTAAEKAAAHGTPSTAQEFIRRAKAGYYDTTRSFPDKDTRRAWKQNFKREFRGWNRNFQQSMHTHAYAWQSNWRSAWINHPGAYRGLWFTLSVLSVLSALITFGWILASVSLLTSGAVFGIALPAGIPLWVGILIVFVCFQLVQSPLRMARHSLGRHGWGGSPCAPALLGLWDGIVWLSVVALLLWLVDHYVPEAHQAFVNLPHVLTAAADSIKHWWAHR